MTLFLISFESALSVMCCRPILSVCIYSVDLWAFGAITYEMIKGNKKLPYKRTELEGSADALKRVIQRNVKKLKCHDNAKALINDLLKVNPKERKWDVLETNKWIASQSNAPNEMKGFEFVNIPSGFTEFFKCPLSKQLMRDPVIAFDGNTYERSEIKKYLKKYNKSPVTGQPARTSMVFPNNVMKKQIAAFQKANEQQRR